MEERKNYQDVWTEKCWVSERENAGPDAAVRDFKESSWKLWQSGGFPTPKNEDWKYTSLEGLARAPYAIAKPGAWKKTASPFEFSCAALIYIHNGICTHTEIHNQSGLTIEHGLRAYPGLGSSSLQSRYELSALNSALFQDAVHITISKDARIELPVFLHITSDTEKESTLALPRILVTAKPGSNARIIEYVSSPEGATHFHNSVAEYLIGENAMLDVVRIQDESTEAAHVSTVSLVQQANSQASYVVISCGGKLVKNNIEFTLNGENALATVNGVTLISGSQHVDNSTVIDHAMPHCESRELFRGIYDGKSRGVFAGTIIVREDAQKTNAFQSNQSLLLSNEASVDSRPQLKIWADDVKCTHGATVGRLSGEELYYLQSRGVDKKTAERMLLGSFYGEVIEPLGIAGLGEFIERKLS